MIVKDEEETLARSLTCAKKFADQIVVADTGSSDKTEEIARSFTSDVYSFDWCDDFSAARNFSFSKADCDLVMWLDADDVVTEENCLKINKLKKLMRDYDMAFLRYAAAFDGEQPTFVYYRERIFRRDKNYVWQGAVHEVIPPSGNILYSDAEIWHKKVKPNTPMRNLSIYQKQIARGISLDERQKFYYGRELYFNNMLIESIAVLSDFLRGNGWVENKIEACRTLFYAYKSLGETEKAVSCLLEAFGYAAPRAEECCNLAAFLLDKGETAAAEFWYKTALSCGDNSSSGGFVNLDYGSFIPNIQLCVLYDRKGDYKTANFYNEQAGKVKPQNPIYLYNKNYFKNKLNGEKT